MAPVPDLSGGQHFDDLAAHLEERHLVDTPILHALDIDALDVVAPNQFTDDPSELVLGYTQHMFQLNLADISIWNFLLFIVPVQISPQDISGFLFSFHHCSC